MTVTRDVNLGTVIPVIMFLATQTVGAAWWASSIHTSVNTIQEQVIKAEAERDADSVRIWSRLQLTDQKLAVVTASEKSVDTALSSMNNHLDDLRFDIRQNNQLLREILATGVLNDTK